MLWDFSDLGKPWLRQPYNGDTPSAVQGKSAHVFLLHHPFWGVDPMRRVSRGLCSHSGVCVITDSGRVPPDSTTNFLRSWSISTLKEFIERINARAVILHAHNARSRTLNPNPNAGNVIRFHLSIAHTGELHPEF